VRIRILRGREFLSHTMPARAPISFVLFATLTFVAACSGSNSPNSPSVVEPSGSAIHDTLNAGTSVNLDGVYSEHWFSEDRRVWDDFTTGKAGAIRTIAWQGIRRTAVAPAAFNIQITEDNAAPGTSAFYEAKYPIGQVNEHLDGTQACSNLPQQQCGLYSYSIALPTTVSVKGGTKYWLLVQGEAPSDSLSSGWLWRNGQRDNGFARISIANTFLTWDLAFAIR